MTRVLTSRALAAPTIALALSAPTEIPTTCGMRRIRSGVMPSSRGSSVVDQRPIVGKEAADHVPRGVSDRGVAVGEAGGDEAGVGR